MNTIFVHNEKGSGLLGSWFYSNDNITDTEFTTRTFINVNSPCDYYSKEHIEYTGKTIIRPKYGFDVYEECKKEQAQILQVDYYMGRSMSEVSHVEENKFISFDKLPLKRKTMSHEEFKKLTKEKQDEFLNNVEYEPNFNGILTQTYIEHYGCTLLPYKIPHATTLMEQHGHYICLKKIKTISIC